MRIINSKFIVKEKAITIILDKYIMIGHVSNLDEGYPDITILNKVEIINLTFNDYLKYRKVKRIIPDYNTAKVSKIFVSNEKINFIIPYDISKKPIDKFGTEKVYY